MKKNIHDVAIVRNGFVVGEGASQKSDENLAVTLLVELVQLGYYAEVSDLRKLDAKAMSDLLTAVVKFTGKSRTWDPFYPGFPQQVVDASDIELWLNAMAHYLSAGTVVLPARMDNIATSMKKIDPSKPVKLKAMTTEELLARVVDALKSPVSVPESFGDEVRAVIKHLGDNRSAVLNALVDDFSTKNKENWIIFGDIIARAKGVSALSVHLETAQTATDVLRAVIAHLYSVEDALSIVGKFGKRSDKKLSRPQRREIMNTLERIARKGHMSLPQGKDKNIALNNVLDDMWAYKGIWKQLSRVIHPFEFKKNAPLASEIYGAVMGNESKVSRFNALVEKSMRNGRVLDAAALLSYKPGAFVRAYDWMARSAKNNSEAMKVVGIFNKVDTPVQVNTLLSAYNGISNRDETYVVNRVKGGKNVERSRNNPVLSDAVHEAIIKSIKDKIISNVKGNLSGKVYVDDALKSIPVPTNVRDSSKGRVLPSGSIVKMDPDKETIRMFTHWYNPEKDGHERMTDIDLSATFLNNSFENIGYVNYTNLRNDYATHSGDYVDAPRPKGASEFLDVDIARAREVGVRYVVMSLYSYGGTNLKDMGEEGNLFAGVSFPKNNKKGEHFSLADNPWAFTLSGEAQYNTNPFIFDLETRQMVWVDSNISKGGYGMGSHIKDEKLSDFVSSSLSADCFSLYELFTAMVDEGSIVESRDEADTVIALENSDVDIFDGSQLITYLT